MSIEPRLADILRAQGVPHRRLEDWKYSDLRSVIDEGQIATGGHLSLLASLPKGVKQVQPITDQELLKRISARRAELPPPGVMVEAAAALAGKALILNVEPDTHVAEPLRIDVQGNGHGYIVLGLGANASLTLVETHHADDGRLRNLLLMIHLDPGAKLTHIRQVPFSHEQVSVETLSVQQENNSRYLAHYLQRGSKLSRIEAEIRLDGEGAAADLSGVSVLGDEAHADITTRITHAAPNTTSRQLFKKVAGGKSRAVYQGKISVKEGAIGSDSRQTAKALLLSDRAEADLKPELEILADDVKCAHGAAVGELDQDSLFYLRSRGIPEAEARSLLIHAFLQEVIDGIENEEAQKAALAFIDDGLARAMRSSA